MSGFDVKGAGPLIGSLGAVAEGLLDFSAPNREVAAIAARGAVGLVPVRTSRLRRSISASGTRTAAVIRAKAVYAGVIDRGWPGRNIIAQPFLSDGVRDTESRWVPVYEEFINENLQTVKGA